MADFSQYNTGPSPEYEALRATLPPQTPVGDPDTTPIEAIMGMKAAVNGKAIASAAQNMPFLAPHVAITEHPIPARPGASHTIPGRAYRPLFLNGKGHGLLIWFHGHGLMFGDLNTEGPVCIRMALGAGLVVLHVQYRNTPENAYPSFMEDAEDAVSWVLDGGGAEALGVDPNKVIIGGPSGGAYITAGVVLRRHLEGKKPPAGQILMIPVTLGLDYYDAFWPKLKNQEESSMKVYENDPIFGLKEYKFFSSFVKQPFVPEGYSDPMMNPGLATGEQVRGLPPSVVGAAGTDLLRDEALLFGKLLAENGVPTDVHLFKGVPHLFRDHMDALSAANRSEQVIIEGLAWILSRPVATGRFEVKEE